MMPSQTNNFQLNQQLIHKNLRLWLLDFLNVKFWSSEIVFSLIPKLFNASIIWYAAEPIHYYNHCIMKRISNKSISYKNWPSFNQEWSRTRFLAIELAQEIISRTYRVLHMQYIIDTRACKHRLSYFISYSTLHLHAQDQTMCWGSVICFQGIQASLPLGYSLNFVSFHSSWGFSVSLVRPHVHVAELYSMVRPCVAKGSKPLTPFWVLFDLPFLAFSLGFKCLLVH